MLFHSNYGVGKYFSRVWNWYLLNRISLFVHSIATLSALKRIAQRKSPIRLALKVLEKEKKIDLSSPWDPFCPFIISFSSSSSFIIYENMDYAGWWMKEKKGACTTHNKTQEKIFNLDELKPQSNTRSFHIWRLWYLISCPFLISHRVIPLPVTWQNGVNYS